MRIGKWKYLFDRQRSYWQSINTLMILWLVIKDTGWSYWYLIVVPIALLLFWLDMRFIVKDEITFVHEQSGVLNELSKK